MKEVKTKYIPSFTAKSIFEIDPAFFIREGLDIVLIDLDNTLDNCRDKSPAPRVIELLDKFKEAGLYPYITSNNSGRRVKKYAKYLGVTYTYRLMKPFPRRFEKFITSHHLDKNHIVIVGDQIYTDIEVAAKLGVKSVLVEPIRKGDQIFTLINRKRDSKARKILMEENKLIDWRDVWQEQKD
ncbi:MAG: YqeG family HAD IIIA-type phosphatase [Coprobacillus sp.]|nr:YqeG family HAD IIIA-type phosphatase [Coprobacillus sp.]